MAGKREHAHELIERLAPSQVLAVVAMLEAMLDPVSRAIASAPIDDEPITAEEEKALAEARANGRSITRPFHTSRSWPNSGSHRKS